MFTCYVNNCRHITSCDLYSLLHVTASVWVKRNERRPRERNRREGRPSPSSDSAKLSYKRSANSALPARYRRVARDSNRLSFPVTSTSYPRLSVAEKIERAVH